MDPNTLAVTEVLGDITGDPEVLNEKVGALADCEAVDVFLVAVEEAMRAEGEQTGVVDLVEVMRGIFQVGFIAGTQFERRGYRL